MEIKSFREFFNETYLMVESIIRLDNNIFKPYMEGKFDLTEEQLKEWKNKNKLITEDDEKTWLQNDEEVALIEKYQADPYSPEGEAARDKIIKNKIPFIQAKVNNWLLRNPKWEAWRKDMAQQGLIALTKAIDNFDVNSGNIFNSYASRCIMGAIMNTCSTFRSKSIQDGKGDSYGNNRVEVGSTDEVISGDQGEWADKDRKVSDTIPDENVKMPWERNEKELTELIAKLHNYIDMLDEKSKVAIQMKFPANHDQEPATYQEIGDKLGMSKMGAQKLTISAIVKLREMAEEAGEAEAPKSKNKEDRDKHYDKIVQIAKGKKE